MNKNCCTKNERTQLLNDFVRKLAVCMPTDTSSKSVKKNYSSEFKQMVNMTFSANILYRGVDYACKLYTHILNVEYSYICKEIIREIKDQHLMESELSKIKRVYSDLLEQSPQKKVSKGADIFYRLTGGNKVKYKANRKAIEKIYEEIKERSDTNLIRFVSTISKKFIKKIRHKKIYLVWSIKNHTWI